MILDTNVVSELLRPAPEPRVLEWFGRQPWNRVYVTAITRAELLLGVRLLPRGRRRQRLEAAVEALLGGEYFSGCLPFDVAAADVYATLKADAAAAGRALDVLDGQLAAIALAAGLPLATRNVKDFRGVAELELLDPWRDD